MAHRASGRPFNQDRNASPVALCSMSKHSISKRSPSSYQNTRIPSRTVRPTKNDVHLHHTYVNRERYRSMAMVCNLYILGHRFEKHLAAGRGYNRSNLQSDTLVVAYTFGYVLFGTKMLHSLTHPCWLNGFRKITRLPG